MGSFKCSGLSKSEFRSLCLTNKDDLWFCRTCISEALPFGNLNSCKLAKLWVNNKSSIKNKKHIEEYHKFCNICKRRNNLIDKAILCINCKCLSHRKCTEMPIKQLEDNKSLDYLCITCSKEIFPLYQCDYDEIINNSFNSNFICICNENQPLLSAVTELKKDTYLNLNDVLNNSGKDNHCNYDPNENILNTIDFKYYSTHDFHKLKCNVRHDQSFSLLHTNISSLQGNFEKLEYLLADLDYNFDIIALTETWNPENKKESFIPGILNSYHKYEGITGSNMKGGCGFYIKDNICYVPRTDLDIRFKDESICEYEAKWIEIISRKGHNIIIGVNYRHPRKNETKYIDYLQKII